MCDVPKTLRTVASLRRGFLAAASLLTVVTCVVTWIEIASGYSSAARFFMSVSTSVAWIVYAVIWATQVICRTLSEQDVCAETRAERDTQLIMDAVCEKRMANIANAMDEDGNVRRIKRKR